MAFWLLYDHLGKFLVASTVWSLSWFLPVLLGLAAFRLPAGSGGGLVGFPLCFVGFFIILPAVTSGLADMAKEFIETRDGSLTTFFRGVRTHGLRSVGLAVFYLLVLVTIGLSVWFYAAKLQGNLRWIGYGISALAMWFFLFVGMTLLVAVPALVQKKAGVFSIFKLAGLLTLDNLFVVIVLWVNILGLTVVAVVVPPIFIFLYGGMVVALMCSFYELLSRKYAAIETRMEGRDGLKKSGSRRVFTPEEWREIFQDDRDDYLNRGFRDFLFPWKG